MDVKRHEGQKSCFLGNMHVLLSAGSRLNIKKFQIFNLFEFNLTLFSVKRVKKYISVEYY